MTDGGWFTDPTRRFGQRYYDGSAWTQHVVGASGDVVEDALHDTAYPPPEPAAETADTAEPAEPDETPAPQQYPGHQYPGQPYPGQQYAVPAPSGYGQYGGVPYGTPTGATVQVRYGVGAGLVIGLVGIACVALSLFAISWAPGDKSRFTDLSSRLRDLDSPTFPNVGFHLYYLYGAWLGYVLFAAVLVLTVLAGIPVPHTGIGNRFWRIGASVLAGVAATIHSVTVTYTFVNTGQTAGFGALSAVFGYFVIMIGMIFGARRIVRPPARPW